MTIWKINEDTHFTEDCITYLIRIDCETRGQSNIWISKFINERGNIIHACFQLITMVYAYEFRWNDLWHNEETCKQQKREQTQITGFRIRAFLIKTRLAQNVPRLFVEYTQHIFKNKELKIVKLIYLYN